MAYLKRLLIFFSLMFPFSVMSTTVDLTSQSNFAQSSSGLMWATSKSGAATGTLITGHRASVPFTYGLTTTKGAVQVAGTRLATVDITRVGSAFGNFAKKVGPVAMTLAAAELLCELSNICDQAGEWFTGTEFTEIQTSPTCADVPVGSTVFWTNGFNRTFQFARQGLPICEPAPAGFGQVASCPVSSSGCFQGEALFQKDVGVGFNFPDPLTPATEQDFDDAAPLLNDEQVTPHLIEAGEPVPVGAPDVNPPVNQPVSSETETLRDADGNITGTKVTDHSITLNDQSTVNSPNNYDLSEKKVVTNYDVDNNIIDESTTVINEPSPVEETDSDIEFDDVNDLDLDEHEIEVNLDTTSWGSGSCPADKTMTTMFGPVTIPFVFICDFAIAIRPVVLLLAAITAAYILSGAIKT